MIDSTARQQIQSYLYAIRKKAQKERMIFFLKGSLCVDLLLLWSLFFCGVPFCLIWALGIPLLAFFWAVSKKISLFMCAYEIDRLYSLQDRTTSSFFLLSKNSLTAMQSALLTDTANHLKQVWDESYLKPKTKNSSHVVLLWLASLFFLFGFPKENSNTPAPSLTWAEEGVFLALQESASALEKAGYKDLAQKIKQILSKETLSKKSQDRLPNDLHAIGKEIQNLLEGLPPSSPKPTSTEPPTPEFEPLSTQGASFKPWQRREEKELLQRSLRSLQSVLRSLSNGLKGSSLSFSSPSDALASPSSASPLSPDSPHPKIFPQALLEKNKPFFSKPAPSSGKTWVQSWWPKKYSQNIEDYFRAKE